MTLVEARQNSEDLRLEREPFDLNFLLVVWKPGLKIRDIPLSVVPGIKDHEFPRGTLDAEKFNLPSVFREVEPYTVRVELFEIPFVARWGDRVEGSRFYFIKAKDGTEA